MFVDDVNRYTRIARRRPHGRRIVVASGRQITTVGRVAKTAHFARVMCQRSGVMFGDANVAVMNLAGATTATQCALTSKCAHTRTWLAHADSTPGMARADRVRA
jgi:hypothetical protein